MHHDMVNYNIFNNLRTELKRDIRQAYKDYINEVEQKISSDPRFFWSFVNYKKKNMNTCPNKMTLEMNDIVGSNNICEAFASFFTKSFNSSSDTAEFGKEYSFNPSLIQKISEEEIFEKLIKCKSSGTNGPDSIPSFLLRDCAGVFVKPLAIIFNNIISNNIFPTMWKISKVIPVFKEGDKCKIENYRPIAISNNFSKIFEGIIYDRIYPTLSNYLAESQHGFVKYRSTVSNLVTISQFIYECFDSKYQCDVIYTDIAKAFDSVNHNLLSEKLAAYGLVPSLVTLLKSFLSHRKLFVFFAGRQSTEFVAQSGVPQGSVLGPLLFLIFINDIVMEVDCCNLLFADDFKIFTKISSLQDCEKLHNCLKKVCTWCEQNGLKLNIGKCQVMSFTKKQNKIIYDYKINGVTISRPEVVRDLGVLFDPALTFQHHIDFTVNNSMRCLGYIFKNSSEFRDATTLCQIFNGLIRSRLEYACIVWHPHYRIHVDYIESVQRKFLKYAAFRVDGFYPERGISETILCERFQTVKIENRCRFQYILFLFKLLNNKIQCSNLLERIFIRGNCNNLRDPRLFYVSVPRTNALKYSPLCKMCNLANENRSTVDLFHTKLKKIKEIFR